MKRQERLATMQKWAFLTDDHDIRDTIVKVGTCKLRNGKKRKETKRNGKKKTKRKQGEK